MIEIKFSAENYGVLYREIEEFLDWSWGDKKLPAKLDPMAKPVEPVKAEEPSSSEPEPEKKPEPKPDAKERMAKARAAKEAKKKPQEPPPSDPRSSDEAWVADQQARLEGPDPFDEPEPIDPVNLAALRVKTTEDLQAAYSNGKHKQVLALLSKYGNGAKSFRELQINDFVPIRKAIDDGALA